MVPSAPLKLAQHCMALQDAPGRPIGLRAPEEDWPQAERPPAANVVSLRLVQKGPAQIRRAGPLGGVMRVDALAQGAPEQHRSDDAGSGVAGTRRGSMASPNRSPALRRKRGVATDLAPIRHRRSQRRPAANGHCQPDLLARSAPFRRRSKGAAQVRHPARRRRPAEPDSWRCTAPRNRSPLRTCSVP